MCSCSRPRAVRSFLRRWYGRSRHWEAMYRSSSTRSSPKRLEPIAPAIQRKANGPSLGDFVRIPVTAGVDAPEAANERLFRGTDDQRISRSFDVSGNRRERQAHEEYRRSGDRPDESERSRDQQISGHREVVGIVRRVSERRHTRCAERRDDEYRQRATLDEIQHGEASQSPWDAEL